MKTDGIFKVHQFRIDVKKLGEPIYLFPFGDVHRFAYGCDEHHWQEWRTRASKTKNAYFIGMGDYDDLASGTERAIIGPGNKLHETTNQDIENAATKRTEKFAKEIGFMEGRLVGLIGGNHYWQFASGITSDQKIAEILKCKYLGSCAFVRLKLYYLNQLRGKIDIFTHHGKAGGRLAGSTINTVQQMEEIAVADIYLQGHDHKKAAIPSSRLMLSEGKDENIYLQQKKIWYIRTGSFLRGYIEDRASYVVDSLMRPADLGTVKIEFSMHYRKRTNNEQRFEMDIDVTY